MGYIKIEYDRSNGSDDVNLDVDGNPLELISAIATAMDANDEVAAIVMGASALYQSDNDG